MTALQPTIRSSEARAGLPGLGSSKRVTRRFLLMALTMLALLTLPERAHAGPGDLLRNAKKVKKEVDKYKGLEGRVKNGASGLDRRRQRLTIEDAIDGAKKKQKQIEDQLRKEFPEWYMDEVESFGNPSPADKKLIEDMLRQTSPKKKEKLERSIEKIKTIKTDARLLERHLTDAKNKWRAKGVEDFGKSFGKWWWWLIPGVDEPQFVEPYDGVAPVKPLIDEYTPPNDENKPDPDGDPNDPSDVPTGDGQNNNGQQPSGEEKNPTDNHPDDTPDGKPPVGTGPHVEPDSENDPKTDRPEPTGNDGDNKPTGNDGDKTEPAGNDGDNKPPDGDSKGDGKTPGDPADFDASDFTGGDDKPADSDPAGNTKGDNPSSDSGDGSDPPPFDSGDFGSPDGDDPKGDEVGMENFDSNDFDNPGPGKTSQPPRGRDYVSDANNIEKQLRDRERQAQLERERRERERQEQLARQRRYQQQQAQLTRQRQYEQRLANQRRRQQYNELLWKYWRQRQIQQQGSGGGGSHRIITH